MNLAHVGHGFFRRAEIGLRNNLQEWRAGAVQIDAGIFVESFVNGLACILFEMRSRDPDALFLAFSIGNVQLTALQIRVKVILARKYRARCNRGIDSQSEHRGHVHDFFVEHGQHARVTQVDKASLRIGLRAVGRRGTGENLGPRRKLRVDLETDDCFPTRAHLMHPLEPRFGAQVRKRGANRVQCRLSLARFATK